MSFPTDFKLCKNAVLMLNASFGARGDKGTYLSLTQKRSRNGLGVGDSKRKLRNFGADN